MKTTRIITALFVAMLATQAFAGPTGTGFFTLTPEGLGLDQGGSVSKINYDGTVDPDASGFITSPNAGEGSVLTIRQDGSAGSGTASNPTMATVTASTHLDNTDGAGTDYQAGVITLTGEKTNESGLGVRAFTVDDDLFRTFDHGLAEIEGSKEISGGTDDYDRLENGAPHVDESVTFDFDSAFDVDADSIEVLFEKWKFDDTGRVALDIDFTNRDSLSFEELLSDDGDIFTVTEISRDKHVGTLSFAGLTGLGINDYVDSFTIRMLNDYDHGVLDDSSTAQHALINGIRFDYGTPAAVPAPGAFLLVSIGAGVVSRIRRRRAI